MKDSDSDSHFDLAKLPVEEPVRVRKGFTPKKVLAIIGFLGILIGCMFGIGVIAAYAERNLNAPVENATGTGDHTTAQKQARHIVPRGEQCAEELFALKEIDGEIYTIPYTTLYSVSSEMFTTVTSTVTVDGAMTLTSTEQVCYPTVVTKTEKTTELVTVTFTTEASPSTTEAEVSTSTSYEHATVTGDPTTVTEINTGISYTSGLPDVTVSGDPATQTDIQTDISYTSGLPDVTVSGNPATITNIQTDISLTSGYPDVTVSGDPSTVTDVQPSYSLTTNTISESGSPQVTIIISDLFGGYASTTVSDVEPVVTSTTVWSATSTPIIVTISDLWSTESGMSPTSTLTVTETTTDDETVIVTSTVSTTESLQPPYPTGTSTVTLWPTGTVPTTPGNPVTTTPAVISSGNKQTVPPQNWGSNGSSSLSCTVMIVAMVMLMF